MPQCGLGQLPIAECFWMLGDAVPKIPRVGQPELHAAGFTTLYEDLLTR